MRRRTVDRRHIGPRHHVHVVAHATGRHVVAIRRVGVLDAARGQHDIADIRRRAVLPRGDARRNRRAPRTTFATSSPRFSPYAPSAAWLITPVAGLTDARARARATGTNVIEIIDAWTSEVFMTTTLTPPSHRRQVRRACAARLRFARSLRRAQAGVAFALQANAPSVVVHACDTHLGLAQQVRRGRRRRRAAPRSRRTTATVADAVRPGVCVRRVASARACVCGGWPVHVRACVRNTRGQASGGPFATERISLDGLTTVAWRAAAARSASLRRRTRTAARTVGGARVDRYDGDWRCGAATRVSSLGRQCARARARWSPRSGMSSRHCARRQRRALRRRVGARRRR